MEFQNLMPATPEGRIFDFCFGDEAIAEMTAEEVEAELKAEGIDTTEAKGRLHKLLAAVRLVRSTGGSGVDDL